MKIAVVTLLALTAVVAGLPSRGRDVPFDRFLTLDEINAWIDQIVATYPTLATVQSIGTSVEGRNIRLVKVSSGGTGKRGVYVDASIHADEWFSVPAALNLVDQLTTYNALNTALLDKNDFYVVPVVNPDGYVYSFDNGGSWRKNREVNAGSSCVGVDPNRNFDIHFNEGGETDPCSSNWPGTAANSAAETKAVISVLSNTAGITHFISLHDSLNPALVYSPAYSTGAPANDQQLMQIGTAAAAAATDAGSTVYAVGPTGATVGLKFGQSVDYAYETLGITIAYTFELPRGTSSDIARIAAEAFAAIAVVASADP